MNSIRRRRTRRVREGHPVTCVRWGWWGCGCRPVWSHSIWCAGLLWF